MVAPSRYAEAQQIDQYRLVRALGAGSMGEVWLASSGDGSPAALKIINVSAAPDPMTLTARLGRELQAARSIDHETVIRMFGHGVTPPGDPYIAMEFVDGVTLEDLIEKHGPMPARDAVELLLPLCDGIAAAHGEGIVHRDIKPENILIENRNGRRFPKLLDFGIAKVAEAQAQLTIEGTLLGTPHYMSAEQAKGERDIDHRSDVWSFAAVIYELVSGETPFPAANANMMLVKIVASDPVPWADVNVDEPELWTLLERAFEKDRDKRWPSIEAFQAALIAWLAGTSGAVAAAQGSTPPSQAPAESQPVQPAPTEPEPVSRLDRGKESLSPARVGSARPSQIPTASDTDAAASGTPWAIVALAVVVIAALAYALVSASG